MTSLHNLLEHIVDYAGLFPPASLTMEEAVRNYEEYRLSEDRWMLARLIVPALRLAEYWEVAAEQVDKSSAARYPWLVSALLPPADADEFAHALAMIGQFNNENANRDFKSLVDAVEVPATDPQHIVTICQAVQRELELFIEIPSGDHSAHFAELAGAKSDRPNLYAKIRTGGVTPEAIPSVEEVADFIVSARAVQVGFKATAGLHHPVRHDYPLTYETEPPRATMHGFLNVFLAASLIWEQKIGRDRTVEILSEQDPTAFHFEAERVGWRDLLVEAPILQRVRSEFAISFGSCSFTEPIEDLRALGLAPDGAAGG